MPVPARKSKKYNNKIGKFTPRNKQKYKGKYPIIFKSKLEAKMMLYLDNNQSVKSWSYEPIPIPYYDKSDNNRRKNYYIDFVAEMYINNRFRKVWIEVKSKAETKKPRKSKNGLVLVESVRIYLQNLCKWNATKKLAKQRNAEFIIVTEDFFKQK